MKHLKVATVLTILATVESVYTANTVKAVEYEANKGTDVRADQSVDYWASDAIQWAVQNELIDGFKDGTFLLKCL